MKFDDLAHDGKTESCSLNRAGEVVARPLELLEYQVDLPGRYAHAGIRDLHDDQLPGTRFPADRDMNSAPRRRVLDSVREKVGQYLNETVPVSGKTGAGRAE